MRSVESVSVALDRLHPVQPRTTDYIRIKKEFGPTAMVGSVRESSRATIVHQLSAS